MSVVDAISPEESDSVPAPYVGMRVAVRNLYLGTWSVGFEIVALHHDGYAIRRTSDGAVLAQVIPFRDVREPWGPATDVMG